MPLKSLLIRLLLVGLIATTLQGCAVSRLIFGDEKPVDEKSNTWGVLDLTQVDAAWKKIDNGTMPRASQDQEGRPADNSDVTFQHSSYASIIALNSACRRAQDPSEKDLRTLTTQLLLGMTEPDHREEEEIRVSGLPGLQTTVQGTAGEDSMRIRTVVVKRDRCVYDLIYISKPEFFDKNIGDFSKFVSSLKLKE